MAALILPEEVAEHLEAAFQLSNRRVHLRLLDEAESLVALKQASAAVIVSGVALDSLLQDRPERNGSEHEQQIAAWRQLRNSAAHHQPAEVTVEQAQDMVDGVRRFLTLRPEAVPHSAETTTPAGEPQQIRGKYRFVPTNSAAFIKRKGEELRLEKE